MTNQVGSDKRRAHRIFALAALAVWAWPTFAATTAYHDPNGRFTISIPVGWNQSAGEDFLKLDHGKASALLVRMEGAAAPRATVDDILQQIGSQWRTFQPQPGAYEVERITGNQRQDLMPIGFQYRNVCVLQACPLAESLTRKPPVAQRRQVRATRRQLKRRRAARQKQ